jgi:transcription initiation factor TFIIA large subunit
LIQHRNPSSITSAAGVTPVQQRLTTSGQLLQVVRAANGAQCIFQPEQSFVLQAIPQMQPGGVQVPVIQQVLPHFLEGCHYRQASSSSHSKSYL